ncbi:MAG TPA: S1 RNA-binding domain-containing protein [Polyangiaceae bacterium]|nr:S1 RNA-binding domain-containing protein [Polyangiaceae bacterium]
MSKDSFASLMANGSASVADRARKRLDRGQVLDGTVIQVSSEFVYVDVGTPGDGKIPVAELSDENGKLRVKVGDTVRASVVEAHITGSILRALQSAQGKDIPKPDEVLEGKVTRVENYGVFVNTAKGDGLVPVRELGLAPGADLRKAFPLGKELTVVVMDVDDRGRIRFSAKEVLRVEEQKNFREFNEGAASDDAEAAPTTGAASKADKAKPKVDRGPRNFGSLGDVFAEKLKHLSAKPAASPPKRR